LFYYLIGLGPPCLGFW